MGVLFAICNLLAAISFPVAAWLARRIGLIRTMVFTHMPANLFLIGAAVAPTLPVAVVLILARAALSSMDVPARQSYTMAVVDPAERTATAGVTSLARSTGQMLGPALAAAFLIPIGIGAPLIAGGLLKMTYDVSLYVLFRSRPSPRRLRPLPCRARERHRHPSAATGGRATPWGRLLNVGQRPGDDADLRVRKRTAVAVVYALVVAGLFYAALAIAADRPWVLAFSLGQIIARLIILAAFHRTGQLRGVVVAIIVVGMTTIASGVVTLGGIQESNGNIVFAIITPIGAVLLLGRRQPSPPSSSSSRS